jgi:uncharacterized protein YjbI with pentapeptide repeats
MNFMGARFMGVSFMGVNFMGANFMGVSFMGVRFKGRRTSVSWRVAGWSSPATGASTGMAITEPRATPNWRTTRGVPSM